MKGRDLVNLLTRKIPSTDTWNRMSKEAYGAFDVENNANIKTALYCVTPTPEVQDYFLDKGYDLLICHHPFNAWGARPRRLLPHVVFHTALDCCRGGLNDQWRDAMGIQEAKHFDGSLGWYGPVEPILFADLCEKVEKFIGAPILGQKYVDRDDPIKSIVVCSGLGGVVDEEALDTNADCYIVGEAVRPAETTGFRAYIETGHTNSEWIGVRLFRKLLAPHGVTVHLAPTELDTFAREVYRPVNNILEWEKADALDNWKQTGRGVIE